MKRLAALAAMALVLGGCDGVDCAGTTNNNCTAAYNADHLRANREKMARHFTPEAAIKRVEFKNTAFGPGVTVIHDDSRAVTCWVFSGSSAGSSCLPDWMLTRGERAPIGFASEPRP